MTYTHTVHIHTSAGIAQHHTTSLTEAQAYAQWVAQSIPYAWTSVTPLYV